MKKNKQTAKEVKVVEGDVCVPCRFPDVRALKTGLKAGLRTMSADPGTCPPADPPDGGTKPIVRMF